MDNSSFLKRSIMIALASAAMYGAVGEIHAFGVSVTGSNGGPCDMTCYDVTEPGGGGNHDEGSSNSDNDGTGGSGEESSGDDDEASPQCKPTTAKEVDVSTDALGNKANTLIRQRADFEDREYGALIYRDSSGTVRMTNLVPGTATSVTFNFSSLGINSGSVIGIVHNHPANVFDSSDQEVRLNTVPSQGDWQTAHQIQGSGAAAEELQLYVLGPDDIFRQFPYQDYNYYQPFRRGGVLTVNYGKRVSTDLVAPECAN